MDSMISSSGTTSASGDLTLLVGIPHLVLHHSGGVPAQRGISYATTHSGNGCSGGSGGTCTERVSSTHHPSVSS